MDRMDCIKTHIICQCAPSVGVCAVCTPKAAEHSGKRRGTAFLFAF